MNVRPAGKPPVPAMLGASYNERHLRRTRKKRGGGLERLLSFESPDGQQKCDMGS